MAGKRWEKILYERQGTYPDNHVDQQSFLQHLERNASVTFYTYSQLVYYSCTIVSHLASVTTFGALFLIIHDEHERCGISSRSLFIVVNGASAVAYLAWVIYLRIADGHNSNNITATEGALLPQLQVANKIDGIGQRQAAKSAILFMATLLGLTPILKTLTEDTSSDTIWLLASACLATNILFFDYSMPRAPSVPRCIPSVGGSSEHGARNAPTVASSDYVALNAAIFASIMLASRLPTNMHVFTFLTIAIISFVIIPMAKRALLRANPSALPLVTAISLAAAVGLLLLYGAPLIVAAFVTTVAAVAFVAPAVFVRMQMHKNQIHGPWDEAVPLNSTRDGPPR